MRYSLGGQPPPGASIDPQSGEFSWTPPPDQAAGKYNVTVSAQGPEQQTTQTSFTVTVTRPTPSQGRKSPVDLGSGVKLEMVLIPAGEFMMGSPIGQRCRDNEKPQHRVRITKPFYLGKYEVTQEQWEAVMGNNPSHFKGPKNPVEQVSWDDCQEFLDKLNAKIGAQGGKFALPTEAQWEYACRAGKHDASSALATMRNNLASTPGTMRTQASKTHPVGEKKPNAWGLVRHARERMGVVRGLV